MRLGAHESIAGGLHKAFDRAQFVGCDAVQIFVKSNRAWAVRPLTEEDVALFKARAKEAEIYPVVAHTSYLLNLASPQQDLWERSRDTLIIELERCEALGVPWLVLHPGAHVGTGEEAGLNRMAEALGEVHAATPGLRAQILLETTAGQGTKLGYRFEHLGWLIEHTPEGYAETMAAFDRIIGLERLKALHLNDCKGELGSRKDRHEHIGRGHIGLNAFRRVLHDPRLANLPGLLETPKGDDLLEDRENLAILRALRDT